MADAKRKREEQEDATVGLVAKAPRPAATLKERDDTRRLIVVVEGAPRPVACVSAHAHVLAPGGELVL